MAGESRALSPPTCTHSPGSMTFKLVRAAGVPGRWIGAGDAKFENSPLMRMNRAVMSRTCHPEEPLCGAVRRVNDLKIEKYVGFEQQALSKKAHNDESLTGQLCKYSSNNPNMWVSSQGINHCAWKLPGREIVAIHVHTLPWHACHM